MSKSRKNFCYGYRSPHGHKQAKANKLRSVPPSAWDDIAPDKRCFAMSKIISNMFKCGFSIEEIEKKTKSDYKLKNWEWKEMERNFDNTLFIEFINIIALNDKKDKVIPITTPDSEPCFETNTKVGLPIDGNIIVSDSLYIYKKFDIIDGKYYHEPVNEVREFPNKKLTEILLFIKDHYIENGMIHKYMVRKWKMGFDQCEISQISLD